MAKDAYFPNVVLAMHMDGANNSTALVDLKGKVVTPNGGAKISTAQYAPLTGNTSSAYFDGSGDFLEIPSSADWNFGTGDFTIECWFNIAADSPQHTEGLREAVLVAARGAAMSYSYGFDLTVSGSSTTTGTGLSFSAWTSSSTRSMQLNHAFTFSKNTWYHVAISRVSGTTRLYINGTMVNSTVAVADIQSSTNTLTIGSMKLTYYPLPLNGYIDDFRITKGVARYTADFTPPTEPFPDGGYEVGGTIIDSNGNPVARTIRVYDRVTGALVGSGVSNVVTGTYNVVINTANEVQVVCLDDALGTVENDQILRTVPV